MFKEELKEFIRRRKIAKKREGTKKVKVEYQLLSGKRFRKNKFLRLSHLRAGDFVSQRKDKPFGLFVIREVSETNKRVIVKEVDCDPIHWKGKRGWAKGPGEDCKRKHCLYLNECPISAHLVMTADID